MFPYRSIIIVALLLTPLFTWGQDTEIRVERDPKVPNHLNVFVGPVLEEAEKEASAATQEMERLDSLQRQMDVMSTTLSQLQETLDYLVNQVIADLEAENADLYRELQRVYMHLEARGSAAGEADVPRPGGARIQAVLDRLRGVEDTPEESEAAVEEAPGAAARPSEPEPQPAPKPFTWEILDEWGRSPEVVRELGENVTSLKGMICHVTPGASEGDIKDLGRSLRQQYGDYDNINIEVFDDKAAAEAYIKNRTSNPAHQVLTIAKHLRSSRDVILYYDNGVPVNVPF